MSFNVAMLKQMREEGLSLDACIRVLEAGETKSDPTNAQRQARHREKKREERNGVTVTGVTPSPQSPPLKSAPDPEKITPPLTPQPEDSSAEPTDPLTVDEIVEAWNERMVPQGFPAVRRLTETRKRQAQARLRENTIDDWQSAFSAMERSAFLRGDNDRGWRADFDFLLQPKSFTKLLEGAYDH